MVDGEVTILQELSGDDERKHVLEMIEFWGKLSYQYVKTQVYHNNPNLLPITCMIYFIIKNLTI